MVSTIGSSATATGACPVLGGSMSVRAGWDAASEAGHVPKAWCVTTFRDYPRSDRLSFSRKNPAWASS